MTKYSIHEFTPNAAQIANGQGHSWVAQEEIDHVITNNELAIKGAKLRFVGETDEEDDDQCEGGSSQGGNGGGNNPDDGMLG